MVIGRVARRYIVQQLLKRTKPTIVKHVTAGYGELAGGIAGVAISVSIGDYYGAFTGLPSNRGNGETPSRNPPFGYLEGESPVNGATNRPFNQALRPVQFGNGRRRNSYCAQCRRFCKCRCNKSGKRSPGRKRNQGYLRRNMAKSRKYYR